MKPVLHIILFFCFTLSIQAQFVHRNYKTFYDSSYQVADIILGPDLWFNVNGCEVLPESVDSLKVIADFLKRHPGYVIEVGVHTDNRSDFETCMQVSQCRAKFILSYFRKKLHLPKHCVQTKGYGFTEPIAAEDMIRSKATHRNYFDERNRRIEIKILYVQ